MKGFFNLLGKLCLSSIFIFTSIQDLLQWNAREQHMHEMLAASLHAGYSGGLMMNILASLVQNIGIVFAIALFMKLLGGVSVLFSWKEKFGATLLLLYLIPATFLFHDFWNMMADTRVTEMYVFGMHIAIGGGLFLLLSSETKAKASVEKSK